MSASWPACSPNCNALPAFSIPERPPGYARPGVLRGARDALRTRDAEQRGAAGDALTAAKAAIVPAVDEAGNVAVDDNGGAYYDW